MVELADIWFEIYQQARGAVVPLCEACVCVCNTLWHDTNLLWLEEANCFRIARILCSRMPKVVPRINTI
ncbi:hypothetical protein TcWFU_000406 [Taenia crassiceps]|uniref:Uncharacterized protein n=1 Tax=Taenia crassiceps TaxID=6207 RepID=A0ABR4Q684_9CEST